MAIGVTLVQGVGASAFAFASGNVAANDTVVIGNITYTFVATPSSAYDVDIGADLDASITNLASAVNADGTAGAYGDGTAAHPLFTASADTANDELDLTARCPGEEVNHCYLAATSPGANSITAGGVTFSAISGGTDGSGRVQDFIESLVDLNQINSEVLQHLKVLTEATD